MILVAYANELTCENPQRGVRQSRRLDDLQSLVDLVWTPDFLDDLQAGGPPPQSMPPPPQPFPPNGAGAPPPPHNLLAHARLPTTSHPGANQPFGGQPMAMSPSSQMMRSGMPPAPQRQNSASGVGWQMQGPGQQRGPPTPSQQMDFQPQPPPTSSQVDLRSAPMPLGAGPVVIDDMNFPKDVQDEANMYFEQIYNQSSLVGDLIMRLKGLKMSQNPRDQKASTVPWSLVISSKLLDV
ncbi:hypothetical protein OSTOST_21840 [Ostertagia ostertagi]